MVEDGGKALTSSLTDAGSDVAWDALVIQWLCEVVAMTVCQSWGDVALESVRHQQHLQGFCIDCTYWSMLQGLMLKS